MSSGLFWVGVLPLITTVWAWITMVVPAESCGRMGMSESMSVRFGLVADECSEGDNVVFDEFDWILLINWAVVGFLSNVGSL